MIKKLKPIKAHLLLGAAIFLLGGCEFVKQLETSNGPKKCIGAGIQKDEVQELLANNAKQYENRIKHLENIIESMGVNVDEMMISPQPEELQIQAQPVQQVEAPPIYAPPAQMPVQAQMLPQQMTMQQPIATQQPMMMQQQNMFARNSTQPAESWQNPNIQPTLPNIHPMAGPQLPATYSQQQMTPQQQYPQQQPYQQQNFYQTQQPIQQNYNTAQPSTAPTSGSVLNFRTGIHKGSVRLVFDTTGFTNIRKQVNGNIITIDLPGFSWNSAPSGFLSKNPVIASYNAQPLQGEVGTRLTLNLKKFAYPGQEGRILPNKDSSTHRMFMDIVAQ